MPLGYHNELKIEGVPSVCKLVVDYQSLEIFKLGFQDPKLEIINYFDKEWFVHELEVCTESGRSWY
jgi:hypothetical protein